MTGRPGSGTPNSGESLQLDLLGPDAARRKARALGLAGLVLAAALGVLVGLLGGRVAGLITAAAVAAVAALQAVGELRRRLDLRGTVIVQRRLLTRQVDLAAADELELVTVRARAVRAVILRARQRRRSVSVALATYVGDGGRELGVLGLRRIADAVAAGSSPRAATVSALLVAQLRSEARGDSLAERPLYLVTNLGPAAGRQVVAPGALDALVSELN